MTTSGILYVIATPIGNLQDITIRAVEVLKDVNFVVAESSARALKILNHFGIHKSILTINSYNEERKSKNITERIGRGESCALITSAGTPCISDPGNIIVRRCYEQGLSVRVIPGPSAAVSAVSISGLFADHFVFFGFLPQKRSKVKKRLRATQRGESSLARLRGLLSAAAFSAKRSCSASANCTNNKSVLRFRKRA